MNAKSSISCLAALAAAPLRAGFAVAQESVSLPETSVLQSEASAPFVAPPTEFLITRVEPGIYLAGDNLGVRIEDDVLVTETGSRVMSSSPRNADAIEALMRRGMEIR